MNVTFCHRYVLVSAIFACALGVSSGAPATAQQAGGSATVGAAVVSVNGNRPLTVGTLTPGACIHTNRAYAFDRVPAAFRGLQFTSNQHKNPGTMTVTVKTSGSVFVCMGEGDPGRPESQPTPKAIKLDQEWTEAGHLTTIIGGRSYDWTVHRLEVLEGTVITVPPGNRWGTVLLAGKVEGLPPQPASLTPPVTPANAIAGEFDLIAKDIRDHVGWDNARLAREALRRDALILETDKTPVDVILRRTSALLAFLEIQAGAPGLTGEREALDALRKQKAPGLDDKAQRRLFADIARLRRTIAFKNPLLDFDRILFLKHHKSTFNHMCDQYYGFNARAGGGVFVLEQPFGEQPTVRDLLAQTPVENGRLEGRKLEGGSFISLELPYDAGTVFFAWTEGARTPQKWTPESTFHVFSALADGSRLRQLTDGPWNDFDPCLLPNGRLAFVSERCGGFLRCGRHCPTYTLYGMEADGSDIIRLSFHETHEWHPSVDNDGMLVYTRWDYVDRDSDIAHHPWFCFPDGRDPRSLHGNYPTKRELRPWMELAVRAIPATRRFVATAAAHHGQNYGSLVVIDQSLEDDRACSQVRRLTPEVAFPESERAPAVPHPKGTHSPRLEVYGTAWPLSEDFYLCVYDPGQKNYGIYLLDSFGNKELLYRDSAISCLDPIPLRPRPRPPVIPARTTQTAASATTDEAPATVTVMNVYESDLPWPDGLEIKALRIVSLFPKATPPPDKPRIGHAAQSLARGVFGTVPVESDGSAHFEAPVGVPLYFQALDAQGMAVQTMRSVTYLHPGEQLTCLGCHERKRKTPTPAKSVPAVALSRGPSVIEPEAEGTYPLTFPRLVQPVLDRKCGACHQKEPKAPSLSGNRFGAYGWSEAFHALQRLAWGKSGGNGALNRNGRSYSVPGEDGARVSKLYRMLADGHHDVSLAPNEMRRITLWLDCNSNFYGAYFQTEQQARGDVVEPKLGLPFGADFASLVR